MSITRGSVLRGPAIIEVGSTSPKTIRTAGDIRCNMRLDTFDIPSSEYGNIDQRRNNVVIELSFTPVGTVDADMLALFLPHLSHPPIHQRPAGPPRLLPFAVTLDSTSSVSLLCTSSSSVYPALPWFWLYL